LADEAKAGERSARDTASGTGSADEAMELRLKGFGDAVHFFLPSLKHYETEEVATPREARFVPVSVTGTSCGLMCDHCRAKILESMCRAATPDEFLATGERLALRGVRGILLTGGSDAKGVVPLRPYCDAIRELRERCGLTVIVHTGLVDRGDAEALASAGVDAALIDIIGADETIREVYHLDSRADDFESALACLTGAGVPTAPHVVIGIHRGRILGERRALEMISRHPVASLVLVVLSPLPGTPMEGARPPLTADLADIFVEARLALPHTPVLLGCARPEGREKLAVDTAALRAGFNGIAFPAEGAVGEARGMGLRPVFSNDCCALIFKDIVRPAGA
jgi:uncharacterized radical SAM superfamily protein